MTDAEFAHHLDIALEHAENAASAIAAGDRTRADACADAAYDVISFVCTKRAEEARRLLAIVNADPSSAGT